jgi:hypothetical protein
VEKEAITVPVGQPTLTLNTTDHSYSITGSFDGIDQVVTGDTAPTIIAAAALTEPGIESDDLDVIDACPTCGKDKNGGGDCGDSYHNKSVDPDVADAQVTIIQIDTGDGSSSSDSSSTDASTPQDGPGTNPDTGDEDLAASGTAAVVASSDPTVPVVSNEAIQRMVDMLQSTTRELVDARAMVSELTIARDALTRERDTAVAQRDVVLIETKRVFDNLANTPLMRRAVVVDAERELETKFKGVYGEDFLKMLRSPNHG